MHQLDFLMKIFLVAGRQTTNEELEEMLEQGNPAVFTQGVSLTLEYIFVELFKLVFINF